MKKLIKVTKNHIDRGRPCSYNSCPVALALQDAGFPDGNVITPHIHLTLASLDKGIESPESVKAFVDAFDNHKDVKPFNFYLSY